MDDQTRTNNQYDVLSDLVEKDITFKKKLLDKLEVAIEANSITGETNAKLLEAKLAMFSTASSIGDSVVKNQKELIKLALAQKATETVAEASKQVASLLQKVRGIEIITGPILSDELIDSADDILDSIETPEFTESEITI